MKQRIALCVVGALALAAVIYGQYRKADVEVSSAPIFHLVGDTEQEMTRLPVVFTRLSDEEEIRIGNELAKAYASIWQEQIAKDPDAREAQAYVEQIGWRVVAHARRKLPYRFHYIPEPGFVNAFALPGGHVFVGQGLIQLMDSEDQLAAVVGHEAEHVDLGHCAERVQLEARLRQLHLGVIGALASIPYEVFAAGYSKEQELAADRDGTELAVAAGYSPTGAVRLFQTFAKFEPGKRKAESPQEELSNVALESLQEYFRSHPRSDERVAKIQELIASRQWPLRAERELRIQYIGLNASLASALARYDYPMAKALASRSLALKPEQIAPLEAIYYASMYTGDFVSAAGAAGKLFAMRPGSIPYAQRLAEALAAQRLGLRGANAFEEATRGHAQSAELEHSLETEAAGLRLLAGQDHAIRAITDRVQNHTADPSPRVAGEILGRIGRWYYLAGNYGLALTMFNDARELDPALSDIATNIGWAAVQSNKIQTAQSSFMSESSPEASAGMAVTLWRADEKEAAIVRETALTADSKWKNERWVSSAYGSSVIQTLTAIDTERQRRLAARK